MRRIPLLKNFASRACVAALALCATSAFALEHFNGVEPDAEHEALIANPYASSGSCGVERWSVKTGTDADVGSVNLTNPQTNTIVTLRSWTAPNPIPPNNRVSPYETTTWVLDATLVEYKLENDSDYHLVIKDASGNTMIAEIPDPACVGTGSPFASAIQSARAQFDATYTATTSFQTANIPVQLTGVGMFDFLHGQTGVAPNGIELHPVLGIVFNPSGGGTADFALSDSPQSVSLNQGANTSTTIAVTPSNGFAGSVNFSASGLPSGVTASFSPVSSAASSTLTLTASGTAATGSATVTVTGTSGSLTHTTTVNLTVVASGGGGGGGALTAVYNSTLKAPGCASVGSSCDSGTLLVGRGTMSGSAEPNQPNTINNSCVDGNSGTFHSDESNDGIVIASTDGGPLTAGKTAKVTATIWAYSAANVIDLYSAANANSPSWTFLSSVSASAAGVQPLSTTFTLPAGGLQAVRAHLRYNGSAAACSTGSYDESDDLIFAVSSTAPAPDFTLSDSPASLSIAQGANGSSTIAVSPLNGFTGSVALSASGLPSGVTASFNPASTTGSSTLTMSASSTAATGTATVTITGTSGSLTHTATLSLAVTASGGGGGCTPSGTVLCSGSTVTGLSATTGNWSTYYSIVVPSGASKLTVSISGGTGDGDLYVRKSYHPTLSSYTCRPYLTGNNETCTISSPAAGTYFIAVEAYATYSGVTLKTTIQ